MGKKNFVSKSEQRRHEAAQETARKPAKPAPVIETRGSLTFDSRYCCDHRWQPVLRLLKDWDGEPDVVLEQLEVGLSFLREGQSPEFDMVCVSPSCGAGCTFGEIAGRRKVVAYDLDWRYGIPPQRPAQDRDGPVTWEQMMEDDS